MKLAKDLTPLLARGVTIINGEALRRREAISPAGAAHDLKLSEARQIALFGSQDGSTPILSAEAGLRGTSAGVLAALVLSKAEESAGALARIEVERQRRLIALKSASSPADIVAITSEPWNV